MNRFIYPITDPTSNLPVIVIGIGFEYEQYISRKEGFSIPQIFTCKSGEGTLVVNSTEYIIKKGDFFFLPANIPHEYYANTDIWEIAWVAFSGSQIDRILNELKLDHPLTGTCNDMDIMEDYFHKIFNALKSDDKVGTVISSSILYGLLVHLYTIINHSHKDEDSEINRKMSLLKLYIDEHYNQDITLDELSSLVNVTPQHLCKMFKRYFNLRPFQYITLKRIQYAKKLLSDNTLSVNEIAHSVGYNDCSYFCAMFKKNETMSPMEFRGDILNKK